MIRYMGSVIKSLSKERYKTVKSLCHNGFGVSKNHSHSMVEVGFLDRAKAAGADSFWYKDISREKLIDIIDRTMAGEKIFPDATPTVRLGLADSTELTAREINVLRLVCDGLEYGEVAEQLNISERTVKYHVSNILSKTGYANKTRLAIAVTNKKFIIPRIPEDSSDLQ